LFLTTPLSSQVHDYYSCPRTTQGSVERRSIFNRLECSCFLERCRSKRNFFLDPCQLDDRLLYSNFRLDYLFFSPLLLDSPLVSLDSRQLFDRFFDHRFQQRSSFLLKQLDAGLVSFSSFLGIVRLVDWIDRVSDSSYSRLLFFRLETFIDWIDLFLCFLHHLLLSNRSKGIVDFVFAIFSKSFFNLFFCRRGSYNFPRRSRTFRRGLCFFLHDLDRPKTRRSE
jgi:hypothetical protein